MHRPLSLCSAIGWLFLAGEGACLAGSPVRQPVSFSVEWATTFGESIYVVGSHPDLGGWNPVEAKRLTYTPGNIWTGTVGVQEGTAFEYKYIARDDSAAQHCNGANADWMPGDNLAGAVAPGPEAPYTGKTVYYLTSWTNVLVIYREFAGSSNFLARPMTRIGDGRQAGESLYRADGFGEVGEPVEFVMHDGVSGWDNAPYPGYGANNYFTPYDVFLLQDGGIFPYWPAPAPSPPAISNHTVASTVSGIPNRSIRVYLPRGYPEHAWKTYPLVVMHDGQNVFDPGGPYGSWSADATATREMGQGRMMEAVVVGIDNGANRLGEYCPPGDSVSGTPGIGDDYAEFIRRDVLPFVEARYRVTTNPAHRVLIGSSLGGLISAYIGFEEGGFDRIGAMSPSFWTAPRFVGRIQSNVTRNVRLYFDAGDSEGSSMWNYLWPVRELLLSDGYAENLNLLTVIGCGQEHNEAAWSSRLPRAFQYLLPVWDEPNRLARETYPPELDIHASGGGPASVAWTGLGGFLYRLESSALTGVAWQAETAAMTNSRPWNRMETPVDTGSRQKSFRISAGANSM